MSNMPRITLGDAARRRALVHTDECGGTSHTAKEIARARSILRDLERETEEQ